MSREGKLVRDRIPQIIRTAGEEPEVRTLSESELPGYALAKLVEEAREAENALAISRERLLEELADVAEIFDLACCTLGITPKELLAERIRKMRKKGGFEERLLLIGTRPMRHP